MVVKDAGVLSCLPYSTTEQKAPNPRLHPTRLSRQPLGDSNRANKAMNNSKVKIVITGGSGFLRVNLAQALLASDYEVCLISRNPPKIKGDWKYVSWNARSLGEWVTELDGAGAIVNLAGGRLTALKLPITVWAILYF
jgi:hypothetical protein